MQDQQMLTGEELRQRREALGLSLAQLGEVLGVPRETLWRWEQGRLTIQHPEMLRLALSALAAAEDDEPYPPMAEYQERAERVRRSIRSSGA